MKVFLAVVDTAIWMEVIMNLWDFPVKSDCCPISVVQWLECQPVDWKGLRFNS